MYITALHIFISYMQLRHRMEEYYHHQRVAIIIVAIVIPIIADYPMYVGCRVD